MKSIGMCPGFLHCVGALAALVYGVCCDYDKGALHQDMSPSAHNTAPRQQSIGLQHRELFKPREFR